jgi:hypothetical protein
VEEILNELVADFAQSNTKLMPLIGHLNCYDWPRVCEKLMLTEYPTVKILHQGMLKPYNGPLDKASLKTAVKL